MRRTSAPTVHSDTSGDSRIRYKLAYINHELAHGDNGRVVGYDNQHGYHHRHHFGKVTPFAFESFAGVEAAIEADWISLRNR